MCVGCGVMMYSLSSVVVTVLSAALLAGCSSKKLPPPAHQAPGNPATVQGALGEDSAGKKIKTLAEALSKTAKGRVDWVTRPASGTATERGWVVASGKGAAAGTTDHLIAGVDPDAVFVSFDARGQVIGVAPITDSSSSPVSLAANLTPNAGVKGPATHAFGSTSGKTRTTSLVAVSPGSGPSGGAKQTDYTAFGYWLGYTEETTGDSPAAASANAGVFAGGTHFDGNRALPATGRAEYSGHVLGIFSDSGRAAEVHGDLALDVDFETGSIRGLAHNFVPYERTFRPYSFYRIALDFGYTGSDFTRTNADGSIDKLGRFAKQPVMTVGTSRFDLTGGEWTGVFGGATGVPGSVAGTITASWGTEAASSGSFAGAYGATGGAGTGAQ